MSVEAYIIATLVVVFVFFLLLKKVFKELDDAGEFAAKPSRESAPEGQNSLMDDFAATEFVRQILCLYEDFGAPDAEVAAQMHALLQANAAQVNAMMSKLLPSAQESIQKASGDEKAEEFYARAGEIYSQICAK